MVKSSTYEENGEGKSELFVPLVKDTNQDDGEDARRFSLADTEAFAEPCCCTPDVGGPPNRHFYIPPRHRWAKLFTEWVQTKHEDNMSDKEVEYFSQEEDD